MKHGSPVACHPMNMVTKSYMDSQVNQLRRDGTVIKHKDNRSLLKKLTARFEMSADSGGIVLSLLGLAIVALLGLKLLKNSNDVQKDGLKVKNNFTLSSQYFSGIARVVDGDTIEIAGKMIRIFGIDAPERNQVCRDESNRQYGCGIRAAALVDDLIEGQEVSCLPRTSDKYGRAVASCSVGGKDLGREIVAAGWAVAFERYSSDYVEAQDRARAERLGLWQGEFELPASVRAQKGVPH